MYSCRCDPVFPCKNGKKPALPPLDIVSKYSATPCHAARLVMHIVANSAAETPSRLTVWDAFGGSGADAIAFLMTGYRRVDVYELDRARAHAISQRLKSYFDASLYTVTTDNSMTVGKLKKYDVVYADPPWGGPSYKNKSHVDLVVSNVRVVDWVRSIRSVARRLLVLKLPYNHVLGHEIVDKRTKVYHIWRKGRPIPVYNLVVINTDTTDKIRPIDTTRITSGPYYVTETVKTKSVSPRPSPPSRGASPARRKHATSPGRTYSALRA